jgi:AcrR family transcriptional regulator
MAESNEQLSPRAARRVATRRTIMNTVEERLAATSFPELRVEDVMAEAAMTRTAFYRYFPDLEAVLLALLGEIRTELAEAANRWLTPEADPIDGILEATTGLAEVWARHRALLRALADAATSGSRVQEAWHELVESFIEPVERRLSHLTERGYTTLANPAETARALVWMNERYLFETFARDRGVAIQVAANTLAEVWRSVVLTED